MPTLEPSRSFALIGAGLLVAASTSAQAQGLFEALFGAPRAHRPPVIYYVPQPSYERIQPVEPLPAHPREPAYTFRPPPVMPKKARPARALSEKEVVAGFMSDSTLERGDIVMFPDGPRVFRGRGGTRHKLSDFEDVRTSRLVGKSTRQAVLAKTGTPEIEMAGRGQGDEAPPKIQDVAATGSISPARPVRR